MRTMRLALLLPAVVWLAARAGWGAEMKILVNHVGFTPNGAKYCLAEGTEPVDFQVVEAGTERVAHTGRLAPVTGDWGTSLVGDFSALRAPGTYEVRVGGSRSGAFRIAPDAYDDAIHKTVTYFAAQRCGPSTTGYHAPCHLDDGRRLDDGQHQDVTGGWHDACDLRKWVDATIFGMVGLARVAEVYHPGWDKGAIAEELRWGNRYFLAMQTPEGYVMNYCAGDDGNRWTDNQIADADDRPIHTEPASPPAQFRFILAQAATARLVRDTDPEYARKCTEAAQRCLAWCRTHNWKYSTALGAGVLACVEMHRSFGEDRYRDLAVDYARQLITQQVRDEAQPIRGFFPRDWGKPEPSREISQGCLPLLGLCALAERFPTHADAPAWRQAIASYCNDYLASMTPRTPYGIVPYGLYAGADPGGSRRVGNYYYRWFMEPGPRWWVGINANLASAGVGLAQAARILKEPRLAALAQRQLDWILGVNPFDASTMTGVGRNQPKQYVTNQFHPTTPLIPGAVMNGIGGTVDDRPDIKPGSWQTCEYWTPMVCYTMWLMSELETH